MRAGFRLISTHRLHRLALWFAAFVVGFVWAGSGSARADSTDDIVMSGASSLPPQLMPSAPKVAQTKKRPKPRPKRRKNPKKGAAAKENTAIKTVGDLSFRFDIGLDLFRLSLASGEVITERIGTRSYRLNLNIEYGYFFGNSNVLYFALPFAFDIDPIVGTFFFLDIGVGYRRYFGRFLFADLSVRASFFSFSRILFDFGGFILSTGAAIPMGQQVRLLIIARAPFNVFGGFRFRLLAQVGVEALF